MAGSAGRRNGKGGSRLGELLVNSRDISRAQLDGALAEQRRSGERLGAVLLRLKCLTEERLRLALCRQLHVRFFNLDTMIVDPSLKDVVSEEFAFKHRLVPVDRRQDTLIVAMDDPTLTAVVDDLHQRTGLTIEVVTSTASAIERSLDRLYRSDVPATARQDAEGPPASASPVDGVEELVRSLLRTALERRASDIHLETVGQRAQVRLRIDGLLQPLPSADLPDGFSRRHGEVLAWIKHLANLGGVESPGPQHASLRMWVDGLGLVPSLVSLIPGYDGEDAVIRARDPRDAPRSIEALGLPPSVVAGLAPLLRSTAGMLLVTGPAQAHRSKTLCGLLRSVYRPELKIVTAEDPIEFICDGCDQHEVNERLGNTFTRYVRAFLRHDVDVIAIGDIRDSETAALAFQAVESGHLVLGGMHATDAVGAITRLRGLGLDAAVCASSLLGVLAERPVRELCPTCRVEFDPSQSELGGPFHFLPRGVRWYQGAGCVACHHSGFRGRLTLAELWIPSADDRLLISTGASVDKIWQAAQRHMIPMAAEAITKLAEGRTSLDELVRVLPSTTLHQLSTFLA